MYFDKIICNVEFAVFTEMKLLFLSITVEKFLLPLSMQSPYFPYLLCPLPSCTKMYDCGLCSAFQLHYSPFFAMCC